MRRPAQPVKRRAARVRQLADPYDPTANALYTVLDLSYYKGKFYLYLGVTPAVVLFWPYAALTGDYLSKKNDGMIFCVVGFLASVGLLGTLWRRYFAEVSVAVAAVAVLFGIGTLTLNLFFADCTRYEVDFLLELVLLAVIGMLVLERALAGRPGRRRAVRCG